MNKWTERHILGLHQQGKIRNFSVQQKQKGFSSNNTAVIPKDKPKGIIWLEWNLLYWGNERSLELKQEYQFDDARKWKFDFAFPAVKIAVEYEGGIFMQRSGHNSHTGIQRDIDKYNRAQALGWKVIRCTAKDYMTVLRTLAEMHKV